jgi:hypothetical protein
MNKRKMDTIYQPVGSYVTLTGDQSLTYKTIAVPLDFKPVVYDGIHYSAIYQAEYLNINAVGTGSRILLSAEHSVETDADKLRFSSTTPEIVFVYGGGKIKNGTWTLTLPNDLISDEFLVSETSTNTLKNKTIVLRSYNNHLQYRSTDGTDYSIILPESTGNINLVSTTSLTITLNSYVTSSSLTTTLNSYVTSSSLTTTLGSYALNSAITDFITASSTNTLTNKTMSTPISLSTSNFTAAPTSSQLGHVLTTLTLPSSQTTITSGVSFNCGTFILSRGVWMIIFSEFR